MNEITFKKVMTAAFNATEDAILLTLFSMTGIDPDFINKGWSELSEIEGKAWTKPIDFRTEKNELENIIYRGLAARWHK